MLLELFGFAVLGYTAIRSVEVAADNISSFKEDPHAYKEGIKEKMKDAVYEGKEAVKGTVTGAVMAAGSEGFRRRCEELIEENGVFSGSSAIIDEVASRVRNKGTLEKPYSEYDYNIITTALSFFHEKNIYDGKVRLLEELEGRGCNIEELERL